MPENDGRDGAARLRRIPGPRSFWLAFRYCFWRRMAPAWTPSYPEGIGFRPRRNRYRDFIHWTRWGAAELFNRSACYWNFLQIRFRKPTRDGTRPRGFRLDWRATPAPIA